MTTLDRMAAAVLLGSFRGPRVPAWVLRRVDQGLGGICLFGSNITGAHDAGHLAEVLRDVRGSLLIATDEEGGDVTRLEARHGSSVPGNAALGAVDDVALTRDVMAALGGVLAGAGIDLDLAPCADVNVDPANPVIGVRSFGADPELVARHVAAAVQGLQSAGVAACAKHFPGHGATTVDSHLDLPVVPGPAELEPFRAAIDAGVAAIMIGHLLVPAIDSRPATLSHRLLTDVLRGELGFRGTVVTDALDMQGIGGPDAIPANVVRALAAGADLCCLGSNATDELVGACVDAVLGAVASGALDEGRLVDAAARVAMIRVPGVAPGTSLEELGREAARRAIRIEGTLPDLQGAQVVELRRPANIAAGDVPASLGGMPYDDLGGPPRTDRGLVIMVRDPQVFPEQAAALDRLLAERPDAVVVDIGWPSGEPLRGAARITTFGASRVSIETVAHELERSSCG